ncbi:MAG: hypothetical protein GY898_33830 [Proteobacteria bacterium]|nr:hypothetical protein [Pseudomonadota bacterium]
MRRSLAIAVVLLLASGLAIARDPTAAPRSVEVYPEQSLPITFNHERHLTQGLQCVTCHADAVTSESPQDLLTPNHEVCSLCHLVQAPNAAELFPKAACTTCHAGLTEGTPEHMSPTGQPLETAPQPARIQIPTARITFSHKTHVDEGVPCLQCHVGVDTADLATRNHLPTMTTCLGCHDGGEAPSECTTCHLQGDGGRILTPLNKEEWLKPSGRFRPDDHSDPRWLKIHRSAARTDEASCSACHDTGFCLDCHDGLDKRVDLHPADWKMTHGLEAQRRTLDCMACHEPESDCQICHTEAELVPGEFPSDSLRFHPEGWGGTPGEIPGAEHHSFQARRSLETCDACHGGAGEALCLECHAGLVNPHPESWGEDVGGWRYGQGEGTVCLRCHAPNDPELDGIRQ